MDPNPDDRNRSLRFRACYRGKYTTNLQFRMDEEHLFLVTLAMVFDIGFTVATLPIHYPHSPNPRGQLTANRTFYVFWFLVFFIQFVGDLHWKFQVCRLFLAGVPLATCNSKNLLNFASHLTLHPLPSLPCKAIAAIATSWAPQRGPRLRWKDVMNAYLLLKIDLIFVLTSFDPQDQAKSKIFWRTVAGTLGVRSKRNGSNGASGIPSCIQFQYFSMQLPWRAVSNGHVLSECHCKTGLAPLLTAAQVIRFLDSSPSQHHGRTPSPVAGSNSCSCFGEAHFRQSLQGIYAKCTRSAPEL